MSKQDPKWTVGEDVVIHNSHRTNTTHPGKVVSLSRKYMKVVYGERALAEEFDMESGRQRGDYSHLTVFKPAEWERRTLIAELHTKILALKLPTLSTLQLQRLLATIDDLPNT